MARNPRSGQQPEEKEEDAGEGSECASRLLDAVLSSLYDFGESLPDGNKKKKGKKRNSQEELEMKASNTVSEDKGVDLYCDAATTGKKKKAPGFFENLKDELAHVYITQKGSLLESSTPDIAQPKPTQLGNTISVVTFHGQNRKKKPKIEIADGDFKAKMTVQETNVDDQEFNLEKARLEVHRFGITGFEKKQQRVLEQERAIMLGAKAPKKEYLNYKVLQEKIKQNKAMKKDENVMEHKSDSLKKRRRKKGHEERKTTKKTKHSMLPTGQVGTFKNGTLILRSCDIKKIKSSKVMK